MTDETTVTERVKPSQAPAHAGEYWIVSSHRFHRHPSVEEATTERARLEAVHPDKSFAIHRVKKKLRPTHSAEIVAAAKALLLEIDTAGIDSLHPVRIFAEHLRTEITKK